MFGSVSRSEVLDITYWRHSAPLYTSSLPHHRPCLARSPLMPAELCKLTWAGSETQISRVQFYAKRVAESFSDRKYCSFLTNAQGRMT